MKGRGLVDRVVFDHDDRPPLPFHPLVNEPGDIRFRLRVSRRAVDGLVESLLNIDDDEGGVLSFVRVHAPLESGTEKWHE